MLKNKKILLGLTGTIADYKICELIRNFKKAQAEVKIVVTKNTLNFIGKLTLETLSNNEVYCEQFSDKAYKPEHISLCEWADIFVIAPISANTISKIANGICDNLLTSITCACKKPIILAPCMNTGMWENKFIQENLNKLKQNGFSIIEPEEGFLACGTTGKGRLADINKIFNKTEEILSKNKPLLGKKVVISAGGTKENIDPVRYIGNYSSGKTGFCLADVCFELGAEVVLVSSVMQKRNYKIIETKTALEMQKALNEEFKNADYLLMSAAISDYRVKNKSKQKIKREETGDLTLELTKNPDILAEMCKIKTKKQIIIGFCAESENLIENAKQKIKKKGCDLIVANDISKKDTAFVFDDNKIFIINKNFNQIHI